jgi:hypothetical protein
VKLREDLGVADCTGAREVIAPQKRSLKWVSIEVWTAEERNIVEMPEDITSRAGLQRFNLENT